MLHRVAFWILLALMCFLAGGAALRESATVDEVAHVGAGLSYLQRFDLRLNPEHPPLGKVLAAIPLLVRETHADYTSPAWTIAADFFPAYGVQWVFGDAVLGRWNAWKPTLLWARLPMLVMTLVLAWLVYRYGTRLGGPWGGLLCLSAYVTTPAFLTFGPLVITDLPVTLFSLITFWQLGEIWARPSSRNSLMFGLAFAAALLSKFTGLLIVPVILALFVQTRFWPTADQPTESEARKSWRTARWRCVLRGVAWAALFVYGLYFIFSWNQPDDALNRLGSGSWAWLIRRPLMPLWIFCRGLFFVLITSSRPTYLFGHIYPHGLLFYFPVVMAFKSTLPFLLLLLLAAAVGVVARRSGVKPIPEAFRPHWRVLIVGFFVFLAACLLSRLNISIRHFLFPIVLLILMLAPLPRIIDALPQRRTLQAITIALAASSFVPAALAYPYFFPFVNTLALGRPVYYLLNDSNVSWNEALPSVERFTRQQNLPAINLDWASLSDPSLVVPQAREWDCQVPATSDAGQWVAVAAVSILENHDCSYLLQYPHRQLAGGSFYGFKLPSPIPPAGTPGGPPTPSRRRIMWGMPFDLRQWAIKSERNPQELPSQMRAMMNQFQHQPKK